MAYLKFNKSELVNLEYSLAREMLSTNRAGGYMSTTIVCCNTRKYHGLLICPIEEFGGENHVLLSSLDETIIQHEQLFNLGIHKYPNVYEPRGHKYIIDFEYEPTPTITYRVGGVVLRKEILMIHNEAQLMIRYTLMDVHSPTKIRLRPFLAYRNIHKLSRANMYADTHYKVVENGISSKLYNGYPSLYMQINKKNEFIANPDWYYNIEYTEELKRGYDFQEDLFTPGYFEMPIKKSESIVFTASLKEHPANTLSRKFEKELLSRPPKDSFLNCLRNSASQFIIHRGHNTEVVAGYPWFGRWGRDTFIALPGLTLAVDDDVKTCKAVLDTMSHELKGGLFPNIGRKDQAAYNSADAPLWYFWAIQQYAAVLDDNASVWKDYGKKMKSILKAYRDGENSSISMHENGLIWAGETGKALTWMDAVVAGKPVTQRAGYAVEINALWYNAVCYTLELAKEQGDTKFVKAWKDIPAFIEENYYPTFWCEDRQCLADYVDEAGQNIFVRPNQLMAVSLPFSPITDDIKEKILDKVAQDLLTMKGIRSLSPRNPLYQGVYESNQETRDNAYHQGTAWVWLLGHYVEANFKLHGKAFLNKAKMLVNDFEEDMTMSGICSISEVYDGDPPHNSGGCISQAWSVSELLRIMRMIADHE
ncbi:MAG: glycogen debranching enzyme N-terminal domain-containing protein [Prevotellaceae bacterium]|jgi:predicted glycogen debranching enzyme|nr:glycogen debranching enzyme N-terminal domain-containing protein [Prevotellaceae bacterium]